MKQIQTYYGVSSHCCRSVIAILAVVLAFYFYRMMLPFAVVIR